jgi:hypothetical protein
MRRLLLIVLAVSVVLTACTTQGREEWRNGPEPTYTTTSRGRLLLMAQSVPDATLIPCIGDLPPGWDFHFARTRSAESTLEFTNRTFDLGVNVVLSPPCDVSAAGEVASPKPETRLYVWPSGRTFTFAFAGGCIAFEFETRQLAESVEGRALLEAVPFMTRDRLRELSGWTL